MKLRNTLILTAVIAAYGIASVKFFTWYMQSGWAGVNNGDFEPEMVLKLIKSPTPPTGQERPRREAAPPTPPAAQIVATEILRTPGDHLVCAGGFLFKRHDENGKTTFTGIMSGNDFAKCGTP